MIRLAGYLLLAALALPGAAQAQDVMSPFYRACLESRGTPGIVPANTSSTLVLYSGPVKAIGIAIAPDSGISQVNLRVRDGSANSNFTLKPGAGMIVAATELSLTSFYSNGGKSTEYCLRAA